MKEEIEDIHEQIREIYEVWNGDIICLSDTQERHIKTLLEVLVIKTKIKQLEK